jgi:hypothetical protein
VEAINRLDDSREKIRQALVCAYGSYIEQEGKKTDQWRDQNLGQIGDHIRHEIEECMGNIRRGEIGFLLHNAMDVMELGAMLFARAQELISQRIEKQK